MIHDVISSGACSYAIEKKIYSSAFGYSSLQIPVKSMQCNL